MGITRLQVELAHAIKTHIEKPPTEEDAALHRQELQNLFNQVGSSPRAPIPPSLRKGALDGETVTVSAEKLDQLKEAALITQATKLLLDKKAGNQKAPVAQTRGRSALVTNYSRDEMARRDYSSPIRASIAAITGAARCAGHAHVGFEIAKSLNIPAALLYDPKADHAYLRIHDFHCDAWTNVPTTCLASEFKPFSSEAEEEHVPGQAVDGVFNLHRIKQARKQLEKALGPNGIEKATLEAKRVRYGITHPLLERYCEKQNVLSYSDISLQELNVVEKKEVLDAMREVAEKLDERLLEKNATKLAMYPLEMDILVSLDNLAPDASEEDREDATEQAKELAVKELISENADALKSAAAGHAKYEAELACTNPAMEIVVPDSPAADASKPVTARVSIDARLRAQPSLWNAHYNATSYNTYQTPDGSQQWRNDPPKNFIDEALAGKAAAKELGFPKNFRQQPSLRKQPIHLSETDPFIADAEAIRARNGEYVADCMAQLRKRAGDLGELAGIGQYAILKNIERRLENVSMPVLENVMRELEGLSGMLSAHGKTLAQEILQKWSSLLPGGELHAR